MYLRELKAQDTEGTILYIHGLAESGLCFEELIVDPGLRNWSHLVLDLPGYGKSPWLDRPMGLEDHADNVASWLNSRDVGPVVILGHSMGAVISLMLCERHPELVQAFINVEGNVSLDDCVFSSKVAGYSLEDFIAHGLETIRDAVYRGGLEYRALRTFYPSLMMCDPRVHHLNGTELVELSQTEELAGRLHGLQVPNVYILGDPRGTGEHSRALLTAAGVQWRAVCDAGHWTFIDQREAFVDEMVRCLSQLPN